MNSTAKIAESARLRMASARQTRSSVTSVNSCSIPMNTSNPKSLAIQRRAAEMAAGIARQRAVLTGFGAETLIGNALLEMAVFSVGQATGQERMAESILAEAAKL